MEESLFLPFDETPGSDVAFDYSEGAHHADVIGGVFVPGREGNCIYFPPNASAQIQDEVFDLNDEFTFMTWIIADGHSQGTGEGYFQVNLAEFETPVKLALNSMFSVWTHVGFTHKEGVFNSFLNGRKVDTKSIGGTPDILGFCLLNDNGFNGTGGCSLDSLKVITGKAFTEKDFKPVISGSLLPVAFYINGIDFKAMGVTVAKEKGLTDKLEKKPSKSYDWADQHGEHVDLSNVRYKPRQIELECWLSAVGKDGMLETINNFKAQFEKDGTQRLMFQVATKPLVYEVNASDTIEFSDKKWRDGKAFCSFNLKLTEPLPVKRVLMHKMIDTSTNTISIDLAAKDMYKIFWGDGTVSNNVNEFNTGTGVSINITHTYSEPGTYYIIIAGVIEDITYFNTNAVIVWSKLQ